MFPLSVRTIPTPVATLVTIAGEIDLATAEQLRGRLDAIPDRNTIVEMSEVTLLAAAGMSVLLELQDRLMTAGARLVLAAASHRVRRVLIITGLDARLLMVATIEHAVDSVTSASAEQPQSIQAAMPVSSCRPAQVPVLAEVGRGPARILAGLTPKPQFRR